MTLRQWIPSGFWVRKAVKCQVSPFSCQKSKWTLREKKGLQDKWTSRKNSCPLRDFEGKNHSHLCTTSRTVFGVRPTAGTWYLSTTFHGDLPVVATPRMLIPGVPDTFLVW